MEEVKYSPPLNTPNAATNRIGEQDTSARSQIKKHILAFGVSLQEGFGYVKAIIVGQAKKLKARNEQEATAAELQSQKMQVEAVNEAESIKETIYKSK
ncbi:hypothetical protein PTKIN_Ptkin01aG0052200 [Pterospermum kingtungense]